MTRTIATNHSPQFANTKVTQLADAGLVDLDTVNALTSADLPANPAMLLLLYGQASDVHDQALRSVSAMISEGIAAKSAMTDLNNELQTVAFDDKGNGDASKVIAAIDTKIAATKDPDTKLALQKMREIAAKGDNTLTKEEKTKLENMIGNNIATIDTKMQQQSMLLKQENEYFNAITSLVKEIMDSNNRIFSTIMSRG